MKIEIREENAADVEAIHHLTQEAFRTMPYAGGDEQDVIVRLRGCGALSLSLVAIDASEVVGQITFSPATVEDRSAPWFALGPVSVTPGRQGAGVGGQLINAGIERIRQLGALGCILTGSPVYYSRFGFVVSGVHSPLDEPEEFFQLKLLAGKLPVGRFAFHDAFYGEVE